MSETKSAKAYVIAVDIGTTSTKTLAVDRLGMTKATHAVEYALFTPEPGYAEQDPEEIFLAVIHGITQVMKKARLHSSQVICVSFSSAMHTLICVDQAGKPLTNSIIWADNRSSPYVDVINNQYNGQQIYLDTGTPIHSMSPLLKLMWLKQHKPDEFKRTYKFIGIKEYVMAKLFNQYVIDYSIASATGLFRLKTLDWDENALRIADIQREQLSMPVDSSYRLHDLLKPYAEVLGLNVHTPFVIGASDGVLANLGAGAIDPGVYSISIGTSGAVRGFVNQPITDPKGRLFCYALTDKLWAVGGSINNGGLMLRWVRDQLATLETKDAVEKDVNPYDFLIQIAENVPVGSDGLIFLPLLAGERAPYWNANARGGFFGLGLHHEKKHMIRSVLEGVMFRISSVASALEEVIGKPVEIRASGGFGRSLFWRQMMADVLGTEVLVPTTIESSAIGAAFLGFMAMGEIQDIQFIHSWVSIAYRHKVNGDNYQIYQKLIPIYEQLYHQLSDSFDAIAIFQKEHVQR